MDEFMLGLGIVLMLLSLLIDEVRNAVISVIMLALFGLFCYGIGSLVMWLSGG